MNSIKKTVLNSTGLKQTLKPRQLNMIAIGGAIGTGLFLASGETIVHAGPGGALIAYALIGVMVYFIMTSLGEMAAYMPLSGSFSIYGSKFVEDGFGFAIGWNYWYNWAIAVATEIVAAQLVMMFWFPDIPRIYWSALFLASIFFFNIMSVRGFGESEFWFALIKVITILIFIMLGLANILGIGIASPGFINFTINEAPFVGGFSAIIGISMIAGFSFQGTELIGIAAGESENPAKNIPIAIRRIFWRILIFYILSIFIIGMLIPYTDKNLLNVNNNISISPFTLIFERYGIFNISAAGVMNAVILSAIMSSGNAGMYASTRMLYNLALQGNAPSVFAKLSNNGIPINALLLTTVIGTLCFFTSLLKDSTVYTYLINTSGMCGVIAWLGIIIAHYRFRKGYLIQGGKLKDLPYHAKFFPYGQIIAFTLCFIIMIGQAYKDLMTNIISLVTTNISVILFFIMWIGYRIKNKSKFVKYEDMDIKQKF